MIQEFLSIFAMIGLSLLIIAKADKQFIHLLEGKLFRSGKNQKVAAATYRKYTNWYSVIFFSGGMAVLSVSVLLLAKNNIAFLIPAPIGLVFIIFGVYGRVRAFIAADRELG